MITSLKNERVRLVRALQERRRVRQRERRFVVEGVRLCEEVARAGMRPHFVLYTAAIRDDPRGDALLTAWQQAGISCEEVSAEVMAACADTETPQGLLAVVPIPDLSLPPNPAFLLILDRLRDPPGTVDATNPKAVRAGMGAHFRLPIVAMDWDEIARTVVALRVYLAAARGATLYTDVDWTAPVALIVGGEAEGAGERARALAEAEVAIPLAGGVESLNAAIAAAVLLFEAARQRRVRAA
jgi:TrmH family RNA methyltransferase